MRENLKKYLLFFIVVILLLLTFRLYVDNIKKDNLLKDYKYELIKNDSTRKIAEGHYQRLVNDMNSYKELVNIISENNKDFLKYLKDNNKKPISYIETSFKPKDTITNTIITKDKDGLSYFEDFYPSKQDYFIKYNGEIRKDSLHSSWKFTPIKLDLVISEKTKGIYEADIKSKEWIDIKSLTVNSLPLEPIKQDNFDFLLGGNAGFNYKTKNPLIEFESGFRYKKNIISVLGNTNSEIKVGFKKLF